MQARKIAPQGLVPGNFPNPSSRWFLWFISHSSFPCKQFALDVSGDAVVGGGLQAMHKPCQAWLGVVGTWGCLCPEGGLRSGSQRSQVAHSDLQDRPSSSVCCHSFAILDWRSICSECKETSRPCTWLPSSSAGLGLCEAWSWSPSGEAESSLGHRSITTNFIS